MTPELWRTVGENEPCDALVMIDLVGPNAHHLGARLVRVPFDEVLQRAMKVELGSDLGTLTRSEAEAVLRAALGEDG